MKAWFIAHCYKKGLHNLKTNSPKCSSHEAMYLVMLTASVRKWQVEPLISPQRFCKVLERELIS